MSVASNDIVILVLILIFVSVISVFLFIAGRRRLKAKLLVVERDMRNPNIPPKRYWAVYDKKIDGIVLYGNLLKPWKDKLIPPFNMDAYIHNKIIYCFKGVTGLPEDDNIVPIHYTITGKTGSAEFSKEMAGAIRNTNNFMALCSKFREGQKVKYEMVAKVPGGAGAKEERYMLHGFIASIGYHGIDIKYQKAGVVDGNATTVPARLNLCLPGQISNLSSDMENPDDLAKLPETPMQNFYNAEWVMSNLGVIPIDDVNAVLENQKSAVAQFNSKIDERRSQRQTWMTRNAAALVLVTYVAVLAVVSIIMFYAVTQDASQLLAQGAGHVVSTNSSSGSILTNILPKTPTGPT